MCACEESTQRSAQTHSSVRKKESRRDEIKRTLMILTSSGCQRGHLTDSPEKQRREKKYFLINNKTPDKTTRRSQRLCLLLVAVVIIYLWVASLRRSAACSQTERTRGCDARERRLPLIDRQTRASSCLPFFTPPLHQRHPDTQSPPVNLRRANCSLAGIGSSFHTRTHTTQTHTHRRARRCAFCG